MKLKNKKELEKYQFDSLPWAPDGGISSEIINKWDDRLQTLLKEGAEWEATIDPGLPPKAFWNPIVEIRLGRIFPFQEEVPIVRMQAPGGYQDQAIQHLQGFRPKE